MIYTDTAWKEAMSAPARSVTGRIIINSVAHQPSDDLVSIRIEKIPTNGSFFGYSVCQKATIELIDNGYKGENITIVDKGNFIQNRYCFTNENTKCKRWL